MRNVAQIGRREVDTHRDIIVGVTATPPTYKIADDAGNKEWVCDVYIGPFEHVETSILRDVPIASEAKELVGDIRQPVLLFRSKQGKYTITGRAKIMTAGAQMPDGSITTPTYVKTSYNLAELGLEHIEDLDYFGETLGGRGAVLQLQDDEPLQTIRIFDAFGFQVGGPELNEDDPRYSRIPIKVTLARHVALLMATLGPPGDPGAMQFGVGPLQPAIPKIIEAIE